MATEMHRDDPRVSAARARWTSKEEIEQIRATVPLGRHGTGGDIAGAVVALLDREEEAVAAAAAELRPRTSWQTSPIPRPSTGRR